MDIGSLLYGSTFAKIHVSGSVTIIIEKITFLKILVLEFAWYLTVLPVLYQKTLFVSLRVRFYGFSGAILWPGSGGWL